MGFKKNLGMGSIHFLEEGWEIVKFLKGGLGDIWMYINTDILTGSEWGILIIVKQRRSTELQICRHFLAYNTFQKGKQKNLPKSNLNI